MKIPLNLVFYVKEYVDGTYEAAIVNRGEEPEDDLVGLLPIETRTQLVEALRWFENRIEWEHGEVSENGQWVVNYRKNTVMSIVQTPGGGYSMIVEDIGTYVLAQDEGRHDLAHAILLAPSQFTAMANILIGYVRDQHGAALTGNDPMTYRLE